MGERGGGGGSPANIAWQVSVQMADDKSVCVQVIVAPDGSLNTSWKGLTANGSRERLAVLLSLQHIGETVYLVETTKQTKKQAVPQKCLDAFDRWLEVRTGYQWSERHLYALIPTCRHLVLAWQVRC